MIRFNLRCTNGHNFESWFQSSDAYDGLLSSGMVTCPTCASGEVKKDLMAPRVQPSRNALSAPKDEFPTQPMTNDSDPKLADAIQALRNHVEENSDYVGRKFADEARSMHEGDRPHRAIHGEANVEEAKKLIEDGVPALPLPFIPRQKTN